LLRFSDVKAAGNTIKGDMPPDNYSGSEIVSAAPIISGLNKLAKLGQNPEPFGYYYRALINALLGCNRLVVLG
jgi:hypothetical protein